MSAIPSIMFPPPPPPPQRAASVYSLSSAVEPSVEDLQRDANELKSEVASITSSLQEIEILRDSVLSAEDPVTVRRLASLTTTTGESIAALSVPLVSVATRTDSLAQRAREGRAAATAIEVQNIAEEIEVLKQQAREAVKKVREMAFAELDLKEGQRRDWMEEMVRRENPNMGEPAVQASVKQAFTGAEARVATLDIMSYAGRLAVVNPFTELAQRIDVASQLHRSASQAVTEGGQSSLHRTMSNQSQATLVGSTHEKYAKVDLGDDLENQPLASSWSTPGAAAASGVTAGVGQPPVKKGKIAYLKANWRDILLRVGLAGSVLGTILGIVIYESLTGGDDASKDPEASMSAALVAAATGVAAR